MSSDLQDEFICSLTQSPVSLLPEEKEEVYNGPLNTSNFNAFILKNNDFWDIVVNHSRSMQEILLRNLIDALTLYRIANIEGSDLIDWIMNNKQNKIMKELQDYKVGLDPYAPYDGDDMEEEKEDKKDAKQAKVIKKKKEIPVPEGYQKCSTCGKILTLINFAFKPNGVEKNKSCELCRIKKRDYYNRQREMKKEQTIKEEDISNEVKVELCPAPAPKKRKIAVPPLPDIDKLLEDEYCLEED